MHDSALAYSIHGEHVTCEPVQRPYGAIFDVRTLPQRVDDDMADLRAEVATLRAVVTELVDTLEELGVRLPDGEHAP